MIGVALLKRQGLATLTRGVGRMQRGEVPIGEMAEGILLAVAGALLLTPGFVTDAVGFLLLWPPTRVMVARRMLSRVTVVMPNQAGDPANPGSETIEGDFERK